MRSLSFIVPLSTIICCAFKTLGFTVNSNGRASITTQLGATWSNGQAIKEYQDFLASGKQEIDLTKDCPSVIVVSPDFDPSDPYKSTMVDMFFSLGNGDDIVVQPGDELPSIVTENNEVLSYPIYIAIPPFELEEFLQNLPEEWKPRREDFVFLSGGDYCGVIEPILRNGGYARDTMTQVLVSGMQKPTMKGGIDGNMGEITGKAQDLSCDIGLDSYGESKIAGGCAACGKWGGSVKERLERNGIRCQVGFYREWRRMMWERAAFDAVFNLIGAVRDEPTSVKDVALYYEKEASEMLWEVTGALRGMLAVTLLYGFEDRIFSFAEMRFDGVPCKISERMFPYVYGPPLDQCNMINEYLNYAKDMKRLLPNTEVPKASNKPSMMRKGNLRADGVI